MAALSICESMLLSLQDRGVIDEHERRMLLEDVVETHLMAAAQGEDPLLHKAIARIAQSMMSGGGMMSGRRANPAPDDGEAAEHNNGLGNGKAHGS